MGVIPAIPAQAGIQGFGVWIPVFTGMTIAEK